MFSGSDILELLYKLKVLTTISRYLLPPVLVFTLAISVFAQDASAVEISIQPTSVTAIAGQSATLTVTSTGITPLTYQWRKYGMAVPGATSATFNLTAVEMADAGLYDVVVADSMDSTVSQAARIEVVPPAYPDLLQPRTSFAPKFESNGSRVDALVLAPDGKIYIAGQFSNIDGTAIRGLARFNADGALDATFVPDGVVGATATVKALTLQADGKLLLGGNFTRVGSSSRTSIARLNIDGSVDVTFDPGSGFHAPGSSINAEVRSLAVQSDGKIVIGGSFLSYDGTGSRHIVRVNNDGSLDETFDTSNGLNASASALAIQTDGKILVGGQFTSYKGVNQNRIARLNIDGSLDLSFDPGTGFDDIVRSITIQADSKILVGGFFTHHNSTNRRRIARLNSDGSLDLTFDSGTGFVGGVEALSVQSDGKILAGGSYLNPSATEGFNIVRLNSDGSHDTTFNSRPGITNNVNEIAIQSDGKILVGGNLNIYDGVAHVGVARLENDGSLDSSLNPQFRKPTGGGANNSAKLVATIAPVAGGKWLVGGSFNWVNDSAASNIVRLNSDGSLDLTFDTGTGFSNPVSQDLGVYELVMQGDGKIIAGGDFRRYNGTDRFGLVRLNGDGSLDATFDSGNEFLSKTPETLAIQADGKILVGFREPATPFGFVNSPNIARLNSDGSLDSSFNPAVIFTSAFDQINAITVQEDGKIVVGGFFRGFEGIFRPFLARLNSDGSLDVTFDPQFFTNEVHALAMPVDGKIVAAGFGDDSLVHVAVLNEDGSLESLFDPNQVGFFSGQLVGLILPRTDIIDTIVPQTDGKIVVGGKFIHVFRSINSEDRNIIARLNADGSLDQGFKVADVVPFGSYSSITDLTYLADGTLLVGGDWWYLDDYTGRGLVLLEPSPKKKLSVTIIGTNGSGTGTVTSTPTGINCNENFSPIDIRECSAFYTPGTSVTLIPIGTFDSTFAGWSGDPECSDGTVTMNSDKNCIATFDPPPETLNVLVGGTGTGTVTSTPPGIDCPGDCIESYPLGTDVTLTATATSGSIFSGWSGDPDCADGTVTMNSLMFCTAVFDPPPSPKALLVTINAAGGTGTVTSAPTGIDCPGDCSESFTQGTIVNLTPIGTNGSIFSGWSGHSDCLDGTVTMDGNKHCIAMFDPPPPPPPPDKQLLVTISGGGGSGVVTSSPVGIDCPGDCSESYTHGTNITLIPTGTNGSTFAGWSGHSDCLDGIVTMDGNKHCIATFDPLAIPAPVVGIAKTAISTTSFNAGDGEKVVLGFLLTSDSTDAAVHELTINASGDINEATDISTVRLYIDDNKNGIPEPVEQVTTGSYTSDNGQVSFVLPQAYQLAVGETHFLVTYQF